MADFKNIIVKMPNWIGDAVMATPVLHDLRSKFPLARLTALCSSGIAPLLDKDPHLTEVIGYKKPSGWIHRAEHKDVIEPLQRGEYDLGVLLTNSFSSAWWFYRGHVKHRIGFAYGLRRFLLTTPVPVPKDLENEHLVRTYKRLLLPLGIPLSGTKPELYLGEEDRNYARTFWSLQKVQSCSCLVGINPGASYGSAKCWPPERFKELAEKLAEDSSICVVFFGDKAAEPMIDEICRDLPPNVVNAAGKTSIRELMALISCCRVFLTNDSGPMHMASALNVPLLALFGSTNDVKTGPYNGGVVLHKHVECSPCYKRVCPIDFRCMTRISVDEVYQELLKLLASCRKS